MFAALALCNNVTPVPEAEQVEKKEVGVSEVAAQESMPPRRQSMVEYAAEKEP